MKHVILVAEDEYPQRYGIVRHLNESGYQTLEAENGQDCLDLIKTKTVDLALIDIMMPKISGYDVCRIMRKNNINTPVIMLTARASLDDRIDGFDCGADDYVTKPFSINEVLKRIAAILRRTTPLQNEVEIGNWQFDFKRESVSFKGKQIEFTHRELSMLELLIIRAGQPVTRQEFLERFWSPNCETTDRTIDNLISNIRKKLAIGTTLSIETVHRVGYRINQLGTVI